MKRIYDWYSTIETYWEWETIETVTNSERSCPRVRSGWQDIEKWTMREWDIKETKSERRERNYETESEKEKINETLSERDDGTERERVRVTVTLGKRFNDYFTTSVLCQKS